MPGSPTGRSHGADHRDIDAACRGLVRTLGAAGVLEPVVPAAYGGPRDAIDSRALCLARETLAWHDGLADFAFAMQGLGTGAIEPRRLGGAAGPHPADGARAAN